MCICERCGVGEREVCVRARCMFVYVFERCE